MSVENLRVRLFGDVQVEGCEPSALGRRQARTLLKILALHHGHSVAVDTLIDCLWVDEPPALAADQISVLVSRLRRVVGADRIRRSDAGYRLAVDWLDLDAVEDYAGEADRRLETGAVGGARAAASAGLALIRGPLLADEADPWWAQAERAHAGRLVGRLRHAAAVAALRAGDANEAATHAEVALAADPFDETALGVLMDALARSGRPASALAAYAGFRWRHQLRHRLLQARLDLAAGRPEAAFNGAGALAADAVEMGAARCEVQARLVAATAGAAAGGPPHQMAAVQDLLERLGQVGGIEAWWITAEVAEAFGVDAWDDLAQRRVAALLPKAGPYRDALARAAARRWG